MPLPSFNANWPRFIDDAPMGSVGVNPLWAGMRNGVVPPGEKIRRSLAGHFNDILAKRKRTLFRCSIDSSDWFTGTSATNTLRTEFHSQPIKTSIRARYVFAPAPSHVTTPSLYWSIAEVGGATTSSSIVYPNDRKNSGIVPDDYTVVDHPLFAATADKQYRLTCVQDDASALVSCVVYEQCNNFLDTTTHANSVDIKPYAEGRQIYDANVAALFARLTTAWKLGGSHFFAWSSHDGTPKTVTSTTYTNPWGGTSWASGSAGFAAPSQYAHAYDTDTGSYGASDNLIPVRCYAYLKTDSGGTAYAKFLDTNGQIAELSSTSTTGEWVSTEVDWAGGHTDLLKVDAHIKNGTAAKQTSLYAAGMYSYEA